MALTLSQLKEKIGPVKLGVAQWGMMMDKYKVGSADYNKAKAGYNSALKTLKDYQAQITALEKAAKAKTDADKKKAAEKKAAEEAQRQADKKGQPVPKYDPKTGASLVPGTDAYNKGSFTRPVQPAKTAAQIKAEQDAADAKKKADAEAKDKADKAAKAAAEAEAKAKADKAAADKAAADKVVAEKELALKTMYVDFLRSTFAGLEDKNQKAQIDKLFDRASKEGWTAEQFQMQLEGTSWWQTTLPSLRSWYLNTHDPRKQSTTVELIRNKVAAVSSYLEQLGVTVQGIDPVTGKAYDKTGYVSGIAQEAVKNGWDDNQLRDYLAGQAPIVFTGGGEIGSSLSKIRDTAYAYGVNLDPTYEKMINNSLLDSSDGRDVNYYITEMRRQALENPNNKAFAEALNSGRTLYEATRSYRGQMANLLEVDESNVTWNDLMAKTIDSTTGTARTFADFTRQVKSDPLWQQTRNAKETYSNAAMDLAEMFGLVG
jgi:chemotaxis protein histidine kinase CheA